MAQPTNRTHVMQMLRFLESTSEIPDRVLLERFVRAQDQGAFNALLRRYGGLVWGTCRRMARTQHDAEDAFQAVFIVLIRRAGSLDVGQPLGAWLYGVAVRVSRAARTAARRRLMAPLPPEDLLPAAKDPDASTDWLSFVDLEVERLPMRYRDPFVLCAIEGRSRREAAGLLSVPEGTLSSRLATAKKRLAKRLSARGVGPSVTGLGGLALVPRVQAVPATLQRLTMAAVLQVLRAPETWQTLLPTSVVILTRGVTVSMFATTWKAISVGVLALGMAGAGLTLGITSAQSGTASDDKDVPGVLLAQSQDPARPQQKGPAADAAPTLDDAAIHAWLQACRDWMVQEKKDTSRIDRWLAEVKKEMQKPDSKPELPKGYKTVFDRAGGQNSAGSADLFREAHDQGRGARNANAPAAQAGLGGDVNKAQGLFIPTADGGWMNVGERILALEKELRETRRELNELKKQAPSSLPNNAKLR